MYSSARKRLQFNYLVHKLIIDPLDPVHARKHEERARAALSIARVFGRLLGIARQPDPERS